MNLLTMTHEERLSALDELTKDFGDIAEKHEAEGTFPEENFIALQKAKYPALTIPKKYGGAGIPLVEMIELQTKIAKADGSTGLGIGWHMGIIGNIGKNELWAEETFKKVAEDSIENGALLNNCATEPASGSPSWGNRPLTIAKKVNERWVINGRKSFATMAPILTYFVVSASIEGTEDVGNFLIKRTDKGVSIDETWDSIAMQGTGSHDLLLENVELEDWRYVSGRQVGPVRPQGWLLHIPAAYLGIAEAAHDYAVQFAASYSPGQMDGTISDIPTVQQRIGQMALKLTESRTFLHTVAGNWDASDEAAQNEMKLDLAVAKYIVVNKAIEVVDLAMRIVGARSLSKKNPLQRYYRDVRAGLHNPPMDEITIGQLAEKSIARFKN